MRWSAAHGLPFSAGLDLRRGLPRLQALRDREHVAHALGEQADEPADGLALRAERQVGARRGGAVAGDERVDEAPHLALGGVRRGVLDDVAADPRAGPELERELLELAQQALLALADEPDERSRAVAIELRRRACRPPPAARRGRSLAFSTLLGRDDAAGLLDGLRRAPG